MFHANRPPFSTLRRPGDPGNHQSARGRSKAQHRFRSAQIKADGDAQGPAAAAELQRDGPETIQAFQGLDGRPVQFPVPGGAGYLHLLETAVRQEDEGEGGAAFPPLAPGLIRVALMALDRPLEFGQVAPFRPGPRGGGIRLITGCRRAQRTRMPPLRG